MKPFYQKLVPETNQSFIFYQEELPHFNVPWHFHPEIEILMVVKSTGTSYIGDSIHAFDEGDVCLIGENLPHWWKSDNKYLETESGLNMKAHIIQFHNEMFGPQLISIPEMAPIRHLIERSQQGIRFLGNSRLRIGRIMSKILKNNRLKRISGLFYLLEIMASETEFEYLASAVFSNQIHTADFQRFNKIHEYILQNFSNPIRLEDIAEKAHMTPSSFCRYFKKRTDKSFSTFLNEIRIGHANRLLVQSNNKVVDIAHECGFNNISHFNEQFKRITTLTPQEYRMKFSGSRTVKT